MTTTYSDFLRLVRKTNPDLAYRDAQVEASVAYRASKAMETKQMTPQELKVLTTTIVSKQKKLKRLLKEEKLHVELLELQKKARELKRHPAKTAMITLVRDVWHFFRRVMEKVGEKPIPLLFIIFLSVFVERVKEFCTKHEKLIFKTLNTIQVVSFTSVVKAFKELLAPLLLMGR